MRFAAHAARKRRPGAMLGMTSLIDATFLLLAYFIFTVGVQRPEANLAAAMVMESQQVGGASLLEPQVVEVMPSDSVSHSGAAGAVFQLGVVKHASAAALTAALAGLPRDPGVVIRVHAGVQVADAAAAMQAAVDAGFSEVSYVPAAP